MAHIDRRPGIRPRPTIGRRLDIAARASFPACITILLMLLTQAPVGLPGQAASLPAVTLGCVWFWSLFRPAALPPPIVFLMGLLLECRGQGHAAYHSYREALAVDPHYGPARENLRRYCARVGIDFDNPQINPAAGR